MAKAPPIPPAQRADQAGEPALDRDSVAASKGVKPRAKDDDTGQQANRRQNTSHAQNVQDR
jgi:hypothetical protein